MVRALVCLAMLMTSAVETPGLIAQVPATKAVPRQPPKEPLWKKVLRASGIAANPSTLKGSEEFASGQIWLADLAGQRTRELTADARYRSPVFTPGGNDILAIEGQNRIVRLPVAGGRPTRLYTIDGIIKLVGFSQDDSDRVLVLSDGASVDGPRVGWLSVKTGRIVPLSYALTSNEDRRMVEHLRGWDRMYGGTRVYVDNVTTHALSGEAQSTDAFVKVSGGKPINASQCDGVRCGQPSLSADGRRLVFIKAGEP